MDVAFCEPTESGKSVDNAIQEEPFGDLPIGGFVAKSGLQDLQSSDDYVWATRIMTGTNSGTIEEISTYYDHCADDLKSYTYEKFEAKLDISSGDSGSPAYDFIDGEAYIIGPRTTSGVTADGENCTCSEIKVWSHGPTAYGINNHVDDTWVPPI
jgi:hypothetical protein